MAAEKSYVWFNEQFHPDDQPIIGLDNRAFAYGDGVFETIHAFGTQARHLPLHFARLQKGIQLLELDPPGYLNEIFLGNAITRLLNKNRIFSSARVRITVFRNPGGAYAPTTNSVGVAIQATPMGHKLYPFNTKGLKVDIYTDLRKPISPLSSVKSCNALLYIKAGLYRNRMGLDDCLLINDQNRIVEAVSSNLFLVKGKKLHTPSLDEGPVAGVIREVIIKLAPQLNLEVEDSKPLDPSMLMDADELFLTNAARGIQWVVGMRKKRYLSLVSRELSNLLNHITFPDQFKDGFSG